MKIQKIFSEVETGERLYSVLMNDKEYSLFSKLSDEEKRELEMEDAEYEEWKDRTSGDYKKAKAGLGVATASSLGALGLGAKIRHDKELMDTRLDQIVAKGRKKVVVTPKQFDKVVKMKKHINGMRAASIGSALAAAGAGAYTVKKMAKIRKTEKELDQKYNRK